jgi:hypothetical protein
MITSSDLLREWACATRGGNDYSDVVAALMIVAIDEETHNALGKTTTHITTTQRIHKV